MAYHTRRTFDQAWQAHALEHVRPSGALQWMRRRRTGPWGGSFLETAANVMTLGTFGVGWSLGWGMASLPMELTHGAVRALGTLERIGMSGPEYATPVVDTRMSYTMRQSALGAMHNSAYSLRSAIGNEARFLHS